MSNKFTNRQFAANLARQLYANEITYGQLVDGFPEDTDDEMDQLYNLIEHEPKRGGLFGISKKKHDFYIAEIFKLIEQLEK